MYGCCTMNDLACSSAVSSAWCGQCRSGIELRVAELGRSDALQAQPAAHVHLQLLPASSGALGLNES